MSYTYSPIFLDAERDVPATIINIALLKMFGVEWYDWEPEALHDSVKTEVYLEENIPEIIKDRIQAIATLLKTDGFYRKWEVFENIGTALNYNRVYFEQNTPLKAEEVTWAIYESHLNDDTPIAFTVDVKAYICSCYRADGVIETPKIIRSYFDEHCEKPEEYSPKIQEIKQERIKQYCKLQLRKIKDMSIEFFNEELNSVELSITS